jgi:polar amino acid transport system substrate-binding protein
MAGVSSSRDRRGASARAGAAVLRRAAGRLRGSGSARWWAILAVVTALALTGLILPGGDGRQPGAHPLRLHETTQAGDTRLNALPGATATCTGLQSSLTPSNSNAGPAVQKILKRGKLIAGIDTNSYLWGFRDPTSGSLEGFDIDIVHALAKSILGDAGKVEYKAVPTAQRISALRSGEVDVVVRTMSITCDRLKQVAFSEPYFNSGQQLLVPKSSGIKGLGSGLKGKRVCAATGSSAQTLLNQNGNYGARVVPVANQLDCLVLMQLGKVDATLTDNALAAGQAAQDPTVHLVGTPEMIEPYGVAMNRNATDLVRRVNAVLQGYRSGQWTSSYDHWLASRLGPTTGPPAVRYAG